MAFSVIMDNIDDDPADGNVIGPFAFFIMTLRTSIGNRALSVSNTQYVILFWIVYVITLFVGKLILMNFIIAVVVDSFKTCSKTMEA